MTEREYADLTHLIRLRMALDAMRGVVSFGALENVDLTVVTGSIANCISILEAATEDLITEDVKDIAGWTRVSAGLPANGVEVIVRARRGHGVGWVEDTQDGFVWTARSSGGELEWGVDLHHITHWRPYPEPPKEDVTDD